jgi:hypothetical protein
MRKVAPYSCLIVGCLVFGCSTMRKSGSQHPGITDPSPNAVTRAFPASATLVAGRLADVMATEPILENIAMTPDTTSREARKFSKADREALGISPLKPETDVNYNITAKCKDGQQVAVQVRLKGESGSEVSVLYGFAGDPELSRDLLDKLETVLKSPSKDGSLAKTAGSNAPAGKSAPR